jgi:hypothetical protein
LGVFQNPDFSFHYSSDQKTRITQFKKNNRRIGGSGRTICKQALWEPISGEEGEFSLFDPVILLTTPFDINTIYVAPAISLIHFTEDIIAENDVQALFAVANVASLFTGVRVLRAGLQIGITRLGLLTIASGVSEIGLTSASILLTYNNDCQNSELCKEINNYVMWAQIATLVGIGGGAAYLNRAAASADKALELARGVDNLPPGLIDEIAIGATDGGLLARMKIVVTTAQGDDIARVQGWITEVTRRIGTGCHDSIESLKRLNHAALTELMHKTSKIDGFLDDIVAGGDEFIALMNRNPNAIKAWRYADDAYPNLTWCTK